MITTSGANKHGHIHTDIEVSSDSYLHGVDGDGECRIFPVHLSVFDLVLSGSFLMSGVDPVNANHHYHHQGSDANHDDDCGCGRSSSWSGGK